MPQTLWDLQCIEPGLHCVEAATPCKCWQFEQQLPLGLGPRAVWRDPKVDDAQLGKLVRDGRHELLRKFGVCGMGLLVG